VGPDDDAGNGPLRGGWPVDARQQPAAADGAAGAVASGGLGERWQCHFCDKGRHHRLPVAGPGRGDHHSRGPTVLAGTGGGRLVGASGAGDAAGDDASGAGGAGVPVARRARVRGGAVRHRVLLVLCRLPSLAHP